MASPGGITPPVQRGLWYYRAERHTGEKLYLEVFKLTYLGGNKSVKEHFFSLMDNREQGMQKYRKQFDKDQREKLDKDTPPEDFDITLLHKLLRNDKMCGLAADASAWTDGSQPLEFGIQFLKEERNILSHESLELSQRDYADKMGKLEQVLTQALQAAERRFLVDLSPLINSLCQDIKAIQETDIIDNMDPSNAHHWQKLKHIQKLFREHEEKDVLEESVREITSTYEDLCLVEPAPWLGGNGQAVQPNHVFVAMELDQDDAMHSKGKKTQDDAMHSKVKKKITVQHDKLLSVKRADGSSANVVILQGDGGLGKSTLMKLVMQDWMNKTNDIEGLSSFPLVLFTECRDSSKESLDDLLQHYLPKAVRSANGCKRLKEILLSQPLLIIVDGYDEVNPSSRKLLEEILALNGDHIKIVVTTRPIRAQELAEIIPRSRKKITLKCLGIDKKHQPLFVEKLLEALHVDKLKVMEEKNKLMGHVSGMAEDVQSMLLSPLNLALIVLIWLEFPERINSLTSMTALFTAFRELITRKVIERLVNTGLDRSKAEELCQQFLEIYDAFAYKTYCREEFELLDGTINEVRQKLRKIFPDKVVEVFLSSYFTTKRSRRLYTSILVYIFFTMSEQQYACANYAVTEATRPSARKTIKQVITQNYKDSRDLGRKFERVLLHLTGILHEKNVLDTFATDVIELVHLDIYGDDDGDDEGGGDRYGDGRVIIDPLLRHLAECDTDSHVAKAVKERLDNTRCKEWRLRTGKHLCSLMPLLSSKSVKTLRLDIPENPATLSHLQPVLESAVRNNIKIELMLDYNYGKFLDTNDTDDPSLETLSKSGLLEQFKGRISEAGMLLLPESLTSLQLVVWVEAIPHLNTRLPHLRKLRHMDLRLVLPVIPEPATVSRLEYYGEWMWLRLECPGLQDDQAGRAGAMVRNMWPARGPENHFSFILFNDTALTAVGMEKLLENLLGPGSSGSKTRRSPSPESRTIKGRKKHDINRCSTSSHERQEERRRLDVLYILTSQDISDEDKQRLCNIATSHGIGRFIVESLGRPNIWTRDTDTELEASHDILEQVQILACT